MPVELQVSARCLSAMADEGKHRFPRETGGLLVGRWISASAAAVTDVIGPGPRARHGFRQFTPDTPWQANELASLWSSSPDLEYLGDWHTHPLGSLFPSARDRGVAIQIAEYPAARNPRPIIAIVALGLSRCGRLGAFVLHGNELKRMRIVTPRVSGRR